MKITLLVVGKTDASYLKEGMDIYIKRLKHYINFSIEVIPDIKKGKNTGVDMQKEKEDTLNQFQKSTYSATLQKW